MLLHLSSARRSWVHLRAQGAAAGLSATFSWQLRLTGTTSGLRGLAAVDESTAWGERRAYGAAQCRRRRPPGRTWPHPTPPGKLSRDIEAFTADDVVLLAIRPGDPSRVYVTEDGGETWTKTFQNADPAASDDCMAFSTVTAA